MPSKQLPQAVAIPGAEGLVELMRGFIDTHHPTEQPAPAPATTGGTR